MKKFLSIALVLCFIVALVSCGKSNSSSLETSNEDSTESFVKPEQYASVLLITINPQFRLYLDENGKVLAVEAVNKDAESIIDSITFENQSFETVIESIVTTANKNGFVKTDATINFEIVESNRTMIQARLRQNQTILKAHPRQNRVILKTLPRQNRTILRAHL